MAEKNLRLKVESQQLKSINTTASYHLVANSEDYVSMTIELPETVNEDSIVEFYFNRKIRKQATVTTEENTKVVTLQANDGEETDEVFPSEVLKEPGFTISIIYSDLSNEITTNYIFYPVYTNGIGEGPLEYDGDSYIDAKIAKEAAEEALNEISSINGDIGDLENSIGEASEEIENININISAIQNDIKALQDWVDFGKRAIYYDELTSQNDKLNIVNSTPNKTEIIQCSGRITSSQTQLSFTIPLPKRLRNPEDGYKYVLRDLAIVARGEGGYYGDYYAHRYSNYKYYGTYVETGRGSDEDSRYNLTTTTTSVLNSGTDLTSTTTALATALFYRPKADSVMRYDSLRLTKKDVETSTIGMAGSMHRYSNSQRYPKTSCAWNDNSATVTTNDFTPNLNTWGLLIMENGNACPISGWTLGETKNVSTLSRSTYSVTLSSVDDQSLRVSITMPFYDNGPIFYPSTPHTDGTTATSDWLESTCTFHSDNNINYKQWIPLHEGTKITAQADLEDNLRWATNSISQRDSLNNIDIDVEVSVLSLGIQKI